MTTWTPTSKNTSNYSNTSKNSSSFSNVSKTLFNQFLLLENGGYILLEDGNRIILEQSVLSGDTWAYPTKN